MTYKLTIYKLVKNSNVLFNCEHNEDLIDQVDKEDYSYAIINEGAEVTYTMTSKGHKKITNTLIMDKDYDLTPELKSYFTITVNPNPSDAKVVLNYDGKSFEQNTLEVLANTPVQYVVSKEKYDTISETVMLNGDKTYTPSLIEKINSDYGIAQFEKHKSDKLSDITLVSEKEYLKMSKKQRSNYIRFDPWLHSYVGADVTKAINDCLVDLYWSLPIVNKLAPFTNGTVKFNGTTLLTYLAQINSALKSAQNIGNQLKRIQKAANKVGLGSLIGILTMAFKLIGGLAGMVYAILYNPQVLLRPYQQMFENYDIKDLYDRTIGTTIPNLEYVKANLNRVYFPDRDVKDTLFGQIKQIDSATQLSASVLQAIAGLEELVNFNVNVEEGLEATLQLLSTMGLDWALGELAKSVTDMKLEYDDVVNKINKNELSQASEEMMKNINGIMNNMETKYIKISDLEEIKNVNDDIKKLSIEEYQKAYEESLQNTKNGETEEQMELKLQKYKMEMDEQNKDSASFIEGYRKGHQYGEILLDEEKKNLDTELKKESYQKGYLNGYDYAQQIRGYANKYLNLGKIYGFIDIDLHIHSYDYQPVGRIDGDKVLSFPDEQIIGSYNEETKELIIYNIEYNVVDNIIIDESIEEEITEDKINSLCEYLYKLNLIMVERGPAPLDYINPYYSSGWKDGFKYKNEENISMNNYINDDEQGEENGYQYAKDIDNINHTRTNEQCDEELFAQLNNDINNYKIQNPENYIYYAQGLIRGTNDFQSEYNEGYSEGWWYAMNSNEYDSIEEAEIARINGLEEYCSLIGTTISEQESLSYIERKGLYRGWCEGWDDKYNNKENPDYKQMYYNNVY